MLMAKTTEYGFIFDNESKKFIDKAESVQEPIIEPKQDCLTNYYEKVKEMIGNVKSVDELPEIEDKYIEKNKALTPTNRIELLKLVSEKQKQIEF